MNRKSLVAITLMAACVAPALARSAPQEATHEALRGVRDAMLAAWEARDIERLLAHLHEDAVVTWQNSEVNVGRGGVRRFYERMMLGDEPILTDVTSSLEVDSLSTLHGGDTAIAYGSMKDHWVLADGLELDLESRFTATLVLEEGSWKLASYHTSANLFDNPLLQAATGALARSAALAGIVGLALGAGGVWWLGRRG